MGINTGKLPLTRERLELHGIFYLTRSPEDLQNDPHLDSNVLGKAYRYLTEANRRMRYVDESVLEPDHVDWLREILLDTHQVLPLRAMKFLAADEIRDIPSESVSGVPGEAIPSSTVLGISDEAYEHIIEDARVAAQEARANRVRTINDQVWRSYMKTRIFQRYHGSQAPLFHAAMWDPVLDTYETFHGVPWTNWKSVEMLPYPIPHIAFGFKMEATPEVPTGFQRSALMKNFSPATLRRLAVKGVVCTPSSNLVAHVPESTQMENMLRDEMLSFPFAIVELTPCADEAKGSRQEFVFCRAANAASRTLEMLEKLYSISDVHPYNHHVPPVVVFTCIGASIRIWIAYSVKEPGGTAVHIMTCIEELELITTWAVMKLHIIIGNLLRYASRILKPSISHQISHWRHHKDPKKDDQPSEMMKLSQLLKQARAGFKPTTTHTPLKKQKDKAVKPPCPSVREEWQEELLAQGHTPSCVPA